MRRVCFLLQVRQDRIDEYRRRHAAVWPEMTAALAAAGWHNYSLFLREDGLLVGYLETDDFDAAQSAMAATEVNTRWQTEMADFFEAPDEAPDDSADGDGRPDRAIRPLTEIFHLA